MKMNFNLTGAVENLAGNFGMEKGNANINCHLELEYSVEEMLELIKAQKEILPGIMSFVKEMQELTSKQQYDFEKEQEIKKLEKENERLRSIFEKDGE